ncbi:Rne/Rng family ribonuclease [Bauldia sp.]|uniref:ribonuclease E/G n=1 Tax=Bauldia sp. TaxID=2575872 RepID=UPI003BAC2207
MANKMLVDAAHPEETRVVVLRGNRVQEFDFESANRKQLRGNIYLAKVTRVEPSLQAAFVDYGGNRHGFLAFSEIHPDYYQIPVADRQALIEAEREEAAASDNGNGNGVESESKTATAADEEAPKPAEPGDEAAGSDDETQPEAVAAEAAEPATISEPPDDGAPTDSESDNGETAEAAAEADEQAETEAKADDAQPADHSDGEPGVTEAASSDDSDTGDDEEEVDSVGAEDALEEVPERRKPRPRQYKIQEVIKRRQVLLVQVVKEERGNKGAALTTYLSLAGRYSVLMPNTARGGGISRKITAPADRKRLKEVVADLDVPEGMGVILRTAGASRTKAEVKRDFEYLLRLWENVRELTLHSTAPTLVYEEGSLIKRSIRDLYNKDIDEILVAGDDSYREAKEFMRMLMPSHAKNVKPYRDSQPLFARSGIEAQLDAMFSPQVTLRSGGYLVINQTEALVAIDVNSGRATREHNIEDTALQTNLEAAEEISRQLRLRDLAGLIVIDFIDMEEKRNNRSVERKLKEALKTDRARIQVGRISHFGLLEMSRQRLRTGVLESTTITCPMCQGTGHIRAPSSVALHVLRSLEDQLLKAATHNLVVRTPTPVALYILNQKRGHLSDLERRFSLSIAVHADEGLAHGAHFAVDRGEPAERVETGGATVQPDSVQPEIADEASEPVAAEREDESTDAPEEGGRRRRRRRRRRGSGGEAADAERRETVETASEGDEPTIEPAEQAAEVQSGDDEDQPARKRRRGRRGGRRGRRSRGEAAATGENAEAEATADDGEDQPADASRGNGATPVDAAPTADDEEPTPEPVSPQIAEPDEPITVAASSPDTPTGEAPPSEPTESEDEWAPIEPLDQPAPAEAADDADEMPAPEPAPEPAPAVDSESDKPKRRGWWQRNFF